MRYWVVVLKLLIYNRQYVKHIFNRDVFMFYVSKCCIILMNILMYNKLKVTEYILLYMTLNSMSFISYES